MAEFWDQVLKGIAVPGLSGLIGVLTGYYVALRSTKYSEQLRVIADFKERLVPFMQEIEATPENDPTIVVEKCVPVLDAYFAICASLLGWHDQKRFAALWDEFKCKDKDGKYNYPIDSWMEKDGDATPAYRHKVLNRFYRIMSFQIKI